MGEIGLVPLIMSVAKYKVALVADFQTNWYNSAPFY